MTIVFSPILPTDIQMLIADWIPDFIEWSLKAHEAGFRRFVFYKLPTDLPISGTSIIVNDLLIRNELNQMYPSMKHKVIFEKNNGHIGMETITRDSWDNLVTRRSLYISILGHSYTSKFVIPPEIGQLRNLETLDINNCVFEDGRLPPHIGQLRNLKNFRWRDNNFPVILPTNIRFLTKLETLDIQTDNIPPELSELKCLRFLVICGNNKISFIPELSLPRLKVLSIANTLVSDGGFPGWVFNLGRNK
jgi:Leucine-rich repeat (LRR) protein